MQMLSSAQSCLEFLILNCNIPQVYIYYYLLHFKLVLFNVHLIKYITRFKNLTLYIWIVVLYWETKGGLIFKAGGSNMQHVTSLSFLLLAYSNYVSHANHVVTCGDTSASPALLKRLARRQVINPLRNIIIE